MDLAQDTTLLIDLQNERHRRGPPRGATAFLATHAAAHLHVPSVAVGEYLEGFDDPRSEQAQELIATLHILDVTAEVARHYAVVTRALRAAGTLIGSNDLWIGCTARAHGLALVTRNPDELKRIPDLKVFAYT